MDNEIKECEFYYTCNGKCSKEKLSDGYCWIKELKQQLLAEQANNKKLVEALEKISNGDRMTYCRSREALLFGCANKDALNINCQSCDYFIAQQALNEVNK